MTTTSRVSSLLTGFDIDREQFLSLVESARRLRAAKRAGREVPMLTGRNIALVFQKNSTRTRAAFEIAAYDQGAHVTTFGPEGSHLGREESIADTAAVLGRLYDGIEFRGFAQETVDEFARHAGVPVWNGLTDQWHPTQMLADVLTMADHAPDGSGSPLGVCFAFLGDGRSNMGRSLLVTGALLGMDVRIATPRALMPPADVQALAERLAPGSGARVLVTEDVDAAVRGADFVHTDVWVSMGESDDEWSFRVPLLRPYRVTPEVLRATGRPHTKFMHCLPAVHDTTTDLGRRVHAQFGLIGAEVSDDVFRSDSALVFEQAENRMHTIKALLVDALAQPWSS